MVVTTPKGFKKSPRKQYMFVFFVFASGLSMYLFILSIANRDSRDVGPGDELPGDFLSRETFEQNQHHGMGGMDNDKSDFDGRNLDAYHRELEVERARKREKEKEELKRLREKVEEEKVLREVAERKLREKEAEAFSSSSSSNGDEDTSEHEKELFEGGFYEKPGLSVERWRQTRDGETKERYAECHMIENSEYWGPTPVSGDLSAENGARNRKET